MQAIAHEHTRGSDDSDVTDMAPKQMGRFKRLFLFIITTDHQYEYQRHCECDWNDFCHRGSGIAAARDESTEGHVTISPDAVIMFAASRLKRKDIL